jgi:hypothetical protein
MNERRLRETRFFVISLIGWLLGGDEGVLFFMECSAFTTFGI